MAVVPKIASGDSHTADHVNQPFHVRSAVYDSSNDEIDITVGEGRVDWGGGTTTEFTSPQTVSVSSPSTGTTYYVYIQSDGTLHTTTSSTYDGSATDAARLGSVTTGSTVDDLTRDDLRGILPAVLDGRFSNNPHGSDNHDSTVSDNPHGSDNHDSTVSDNPHGSDNHDGSVADDPHGVSAHSEVFAAENNNLSDITTHSAADSANDTTVTLFNVTSGPGVVLGGMVWGLLSSVTLTIDGTSNSLPVETVQDGNADSIEMAHVPPVHFDSSAKLEWTNTATSSRDRSGIAHTKTF